MTYQEIIALRESLGMSRREFAQRIGTTYESLCRWEKDRRGPSKYYIEAMQRLVQRQRAGVANEQWILWDSNLCRVRKYVRESQGLVLGTVEAPNDSGGRFVIASIRLQKLTRTLSSLDALLPPKLEASSPRMRIVGMFAGGDQLTEPTESMVSLLINTHQFDAGYAVLCDRGSMEISIWRPNLQKSDAMRITARMCFPVQYWIVGNLKQTPD